MHVRHSIIEARGPVAFPAYAGERHYMRPITKGGLPKDLRHWQPTIDAMLAGIDTDSTMYLMIDQSAVKAGSTQRRPGLHIDGYWVPDDTTAAGGRWDGGRWSRGRWDGDGGSWNTAHFNAPEALLLASNVQAARGFTGTFTGFIGEGGDCSGIDLSGLKELPMEAGRVYAGNVTSLHESLPVASDCFRTVVRISVPGWSPRPC